MEEHTLVCLLPVRNGARDLPGYLESAARFADAVVALDDGSTDDTRAILEREPLVKVVLANPRRDSYVGWDDAANRKRVLEAAAPLRPRWVFFLDADERVSADDAVALRGFVETQAIPGVAYGFRGHRMIDDLEHYDRSSLWFYRMFAWRPGLRLPESRLHFVPVPVDIPPDRWIRTTIRLQHMAGIDAARRAARHRKYQEVDPEAEHQASYEHILDPPQALKPWRRRTPGEPVVKQEARHRRLALQLAARSGAEERGHPALSAIVITQNDRDRIEAVLEALVQQETREPFEVILVDSGSDGTADLVRRRYPQVRMVELREPALPGRARNAGLRVARGRIISFPGSHVVLPPGSLQHRIDAHAEGFALVTGSILNGTPTLSGWASYFLDHSESLPGRPSGALTDAPSHCSYRAAALAEVGGFPEDRRVGEDTLVNQMLFARGHRAGRYAPIRLVHRSPCRTPWRLLRHHYQRGRGYGRILWERDGASARLRGRFHRIVEIVGSYPVKRLRTVTGNVMRWGHPYRLRYVVSAPWVLSGVLAAMLGALVFLVRPARSAVGVTHRHTTPPPVFETERPTLFYVVTRRHAEVMAPYVTGWGPSPERRMAYVFYEDLPDTSRLPSGTYLFADLERLGPRQIELASRVWEELAKDPERASALNDPRRVLRRYDLLQRLHAAGLNRFRAIRASESWGDLRFPVFLHEERGHAGALTPLIHDEAALRRALRSARLRGHRARDLLVTEFCDTSDAQGIFRKYSAFRVGDEILPRHVFFSRDWQLKRPDLESPELARERDLYLIRNPHEEALREIFELAGIEFGRIDYSLLDGETQVWEINTNPTVRRRAEGITRALEALCPVFESRDPLPIRLPADLAAAAAREQGAETWRAGMRSAVRLPGILSAALRSRLRSRTPKGQVNGGV